MKPHYTNNASIFERRGDPWVSARDSKRDYGTNPLADDPDMDQFTRAKRSRFGPDEAEHKASIFGPVVKAKPPEPISLERRIQNIKMRMHRKIGEVERSRQAIKTPDRQGDFRPKSIFDK